METGLCTRRSSPNATLVLDAVCQADYLSCILHLGFVVFSSLCLILYGCCRPLKRDKTPYTLHYSFHHVRWLLFICLIFVNIFFVLEGILSDLKSPSPQPRPHLYLPAICACVAVLLVGVYYHHMEAWLRPGFVWLLLLYWGLALTCEGLRLASWMQDASRVDTTIVRFDVMVISVGLYSVLVLLECSALLAKFLGHTDQMSGRVPEDLQNSSMKYYMRFVSLPSLLAFKWLGWLMQLGYQRPLEVSDLGDLPKMSTSRWNKNIFERCLQQEKERATSKGGLGKFSLYRVMVKAYIKWQALAVLLKLIADSLNFVAPITVNGIITYASAVYYKTEEKDSKFPEYVTVGEYFRNGFVLLAFIFLAGVIRFVILQSYYHVTILASIHLRTGLQVRCHSSGSAITS